jgi:pimeloyl-ACP methyl ester carboxylesterase
VKSIILKSGRTLSFSEFGNISSKRVILYCHGFPGTGEEVGLAHKSALENDIRIIAPTRPGIGYSDYDPERAILTWPKLIEELLAALNIEQFNLLGISAGTPYALSCIATFGPRIERCLIVSGMGPPASVDLSARMSVMSRIPLWCAYHLPIISASMITLLSIAAKNSPRTLLGAYQFFMSKDDQRVLKKSRIAECLLKNLELALHQGARGIRHDFRLMTNEWGYPLENIDFPITIYHGDEDNLVPLAIAQQNSLALKKSVLKVFPGKGHFMAFEISDQIISFFAAA